MRFTQKMYSMKTNFLHLAWLLPLFFLLHGGYQQAIYSGLSDTYESGNSYVSEVIDFDVKQIAAQTNGYVVLRFETPDGVMEEKLSLPVQMAQVIMDSEKIAIRYKAASFRPIVMIPVYELQRKVVRVNLAVVSIGFVVTLLIAWRASVFAVRRRRTGEQGLKIERIDQMEGVS